MSAVASALKFVDLGRRGFERARDEQFRLAAERAEGRIPDTVVFCEHDPIYTRGTSCKGPAPAGLPHPIVDAERGGDITYHGPGQLVGYPIIHLRERGLLVGTYLRELEGALIDALASLGLRAEAVPGKTGVWSDGRKVASIGVTVRGWVSAHGFALNCDLDLAPFSAVRPCGFSPKVMTSLSELLRRPVSLAEARGVVAEAMAKRFS